MAPAYIITHTASCQDNFLPNYLYLTRLDNGSYIGDKHYYDNSIYDNVLLTLNEMEQIISGIAFPGLYMINPVTNTIIDF